MMKRASIATAAAAVLAVVFACQPADAATKKRKLTPVAQYMVDQHGNTVSFAKVVFTNTKTGETRSATTDAYGYFEAKLPDGEYRCGLWFEDKLVKSWHPCAIVGDPRFDIEAFFVPTVDPRIPAEIHEDAVDIIPPQDIDGEEEWDDLGPNDPPGARDDEPDVDVEVDPRIDDEGDDEDDVNLISARGQPLVVEFDNPFSSDGGGGDGGGDGGGGDGGGGGQ